MISAGTLVKKFTTASISINWLKMILIICKMFAKIIPNSISDMVYLDENKAVCRILDQHPNTTQKRLSFLVSPTLTAKQFIQQVSTQYSYEKFDLVLEYNKVSKLSTLKWMKNFLMRIRGWFDVFIMTSVSYDYSGNRVLIKENFSQI